jgi:plastocyanin/mono/diheme cytochrome c family protein
MNTSKQINAMVILLSILLIGVGFYTVWDPTRAEKETDHTNELIVERAAHTFAQNCRVCHGNQGEGRIGPPLNPAFRTDQQVNFTDAATRAEKQLLVTNTISCGRVGTRMPPWDTSQGGSLNQEQIRQLMILITENPGGNAWDTVAQASKDADLIATMPPVQDVPLNITGSNSYVCGQKPVGTPEPTVAPTPGAVVTNATVTTTDNKFDVNAITIKAGTAVTITTTNKGSAVHNFSVLDPKDASGKAVLKDAAGKDIQTQPLTAGNTGTLNFTISTPGEYKFECTFHPTEMTGVLFVQ